jgi:hypothetical protein
LSVVVADQESKIAKVIHECRWNVRHEYDADHARNALDCYCQKSPKEERPLLHGLRRRSRDWFNQVLHQTIARDRKIEMWENALNHYRGDHSKWNHPADQGYQGKNQNMAELK